MRIVAGKYRSRQLRSLKGLALRPTSDRLRETLFNVLSPSIQGARFLDIFAGTGAIGIEALSRGASEAVFLEDHPPAVKLIRHNLDSLDIRSGFEVLSGDAVRGLEKLAERAKNGVSAFDIVFLDPPYAAAADCQRVLTCLSASPLLKESAIVIAEHSRKLDLPEHVGTLHRYRILRQGDAALSFFRLEQESPAPRDS